MRLFLASFGLFVLACSSELPEEPPSAARVELDPAAYDAGWVLRVGGSCFVHDGQTPVDVPVDEWALVERWSEDEPEHRWLPLEPGLLLRVIGAKAELELSTDLPSFTPEPDEQEPFGPEP